MAVNFEDWHLVELEQLGKFEGSPFFKADSPVAVGGACVGKDPPKNLASAVDVEVVKSNVRHLSTSGWAEARFFCVILGEVMELGLGSGIS